MVYGKDLEIPEEGIWKRMWRKRLRFSNPLPYPWTPMPALGSMGRLGLRKENHSNEGYLPSGIGKVGGNNDGWWTTSGDSW
jgi:hypothetical protein